MHPRSAAPAGIRATMNSSSMFRMDVGVGFGKLMAGPDVVRWVDLCQLQFSIILNNKERWQNRSSQLGSTAWERSAAAVSALNRKRKAQSQIVETQEESTAETHPARQACRAFLCQLGRERRLEALACRSFALL